MRYVEALKSLPQPPRTSDAEVRRFSTQLEIDLRRREKWLALLQTVEKLDPMDILRWIAEAQKAGDLDEALWRAFLSAHFGADPRNPREATSAGRLLCAFGTTPLWTWSRVSQNPAALLEWLIRHQDQLATLRFGNHRKFEAKKASKLFEVIAGFVDWIRRFGGSPQEAFGTKGCDTPEERFDQLFFRVKAIPRFGRLAAFDMLCLFGDMGILPVKPGSCYLDGATGPLNGAKRLWGNESAARLTELADEAARRLEVPIEAFEDALCNWQKPPRRRRRRLS